MSKRVLTKTWIPPKWPEGTHSGNQIGRSPEPGTGRWSQEFNQPGEFIGWVTNYEELSDGMGGQNVAHYSAAAVKRKDGTVDEVLICNLKFEELSTTRKMIVKAIAWFAILFVGYIIADAIIWLLKHN